MITQEEARKLTQIRYTDSPTEKQRRGQIYAEAFQATVEEVCGPRYKDGRFIDRFIAYVRRYGKEGDDSLVFKISTGDHVPCIMHTDGTVVVGSKFYVTDGEKAS